MATKINSVRGMNDILPEQTPYWQFLENLIRNLVAQYGYHEIRTPILEATQLFTHAIGDLTDIVAKEMYTFLDNEKNSLTLRPEGTAACVRAGIEHGIFHNQQQKLWYIGPMFRHERPQKGRYRQFYQFGVEAVGFDNPLIDAEIIAMSARLWHELQLSQHVTLEINTLGTLTERNQYKALLIDYFKAHLQQLDEDSVRRLDQNPLRILDSKNPEMQQLIQHAPQLKDHLGAESTAHFETLLSVLQSLKIPYKINPYLVRGIDYYGGTVFEWVTDKLGAQGTVCAGGRYDSLIAAHGGSATPAIGFACGLERIVHLLEASELATNIADQHKPDVFIVAVGEKASVYSLQLAERLRDKLPQLKIITANSNASYKNQFKKADKSQAKFALIIGEDEMQNNSITVKNLRHDQPQQSLSFAALLDFLGG